MPNSYVDLIKKKSSIIIVIAAFVAVIYVAYSLTAARDDLKPGADSSVVVVSSTETPGQRQVGAETKPDALPSPSTVLKVPDVEHMIANYLPSLHDPHIECDAGSCTITASPAPTATGFDQSAFERLVTQDVPSAISHSGYALLEPVQMEEVGADTYRLKFRIGTKKGL